MGDSYSTEEVTTPLSLLSRLKSPQPSVAARKRKIACNPPTGKRRSLGRSSVTDPKSIKPDERVRAYPAEPFTVSGGHLFCSGCRERLCLKKSSIKNHIGSKKHEDGKKRLEDKQARERDLAASLRRYNLEHHPRGETLPEFQQVYRIRVTRTFLQAGVPMNKLPIFRSILEENGHRLSDKRFMLDLVPFLLEEEEKTLKGLIQDKHLGVIFDGTTRLGEALAVVVRFVSDDWELEQRLLRIQLLSKSLTGEEIASELIKILSVNYSIGPAHLIAAMRDRASVNNVAMRTLKIVYPSIVDIGCFSHTIDLVGKHFKVPHAYEFLTSWMALFSHSYKAKIAWGEQTGKAMPSYSATRWWSKWEILDQLLVSFGDIKLFLDNNPDLGPASRDKLLEFFTNTQKNIYLKLELAAIVDWGRPFVTATYNLEGDGPLVFTCYETVQTTVSAIQVANTPNVDAIIRAISSIPRQQMVKYVKNCVQPGLDYFDKQLNTSLKVSLSAFKAARLLCPYQVNTLNPTAADVDELSAFPFVDNLASLKSELASYLAKSDSLNSSMDIVSWWKQYTHDLPAWSAAAKKVLVVQPSSAAAERVFSILNSTFKEQQQNSLQDYIETSVMLSYNYRK